MTKLRLAVFWDQFGGPTEAVISKGEISGLRKLGIDVELLTIRTVPLEKYRDMVHGIKVRSLEKKAPWPLRLTKKLPGFHFLSLFHLISPFYSPLVFREKYDMLITHQTFTCFTSVMLKKLRGLPYIAIIWDPISYILLRIYSESSLSTLFPILVPFGRSLDRLVVGSSEAVILPSNYHKNLMTNLISKPIEIVYPGTSVSPKILSKRGDYFITVARWESGKRPFFLLGALEELKRRSKRPTLVMVGSWPSETLRTEFLREAKSKGLLDMIKITGRVNHEFLSDMYSGARALVHPICESFGMTGLESAAHGAPIIFPKNSGVTDLFTDGIHGFFPEEGSLQAFADYMEVLLSDERKAWRMGFDAWQTAKNYTWTNHARRLYGVVEKYV